MQLTVKTHLGGHLSILGLVTILAFTGCLSYAEKRSMSSLDELPTSGQPPASPAAEDTSPDVSTLSSKGKGQTPEQRARTADTRFIVRFEEEPLLSDVAKNFRRDQKSARASYHLWQTRNRDMLGIELVRASYSGELVLRLPRNDPQRRTAEDVLAALRAIDANVYAERDLQYQPRQ